MLWSSSGQLFFDRGLHEYVNQDCHKVFEWILHIEKSLNLFYVKLKLCV